MAILLSDTFDRANSTTSPGAPEVGGPYTVQSGVAGIISNQLYFPTPNTTALGSHLTFPAAIDCEIEATLGPPQSGFQLLIVRYVSATSLWAFGCAASGYGFYTVRGTSLLAVTPIASSGGAPIATAGDVVRVVARGNYIYGYVNDIFVHAIEDLNYQNAVGVGGVVMRSLNHRFDNLIARDAPAATTDPAHLYKGRDTEALDEGNEA